MQTSDIELLEKCNNLFPVLLRLFKFVFASYLWSVEDAKSSGLVFSILVGLKR